MDENLPIFLQVKFQKASEDSLFALQLTCVAMLLKVGSLFAFLNFLFISCFCYFDAEQADYQCRSAT